MTHTMKAETQTEKLPWWWVSKYADMEPRVHPVNATNPGPHVSIGMSYGYRDCSARVQASDRDEAIEAAESAWLDLANNIRTLI